MVGWNEWVGKKVYVVVKGRPYSGKVIDVHDSGDNLIFLEIIDKFNQHVCFTTKEIELIKEENY